MRVAVLFVLVASGPAAAGDDPCASATAKVTGAAMSPIGREAHDFTPNRSERQAIGRAAKRMNVSLYEGKEAKLVAAGFDRWIAGGADLEVLQAITLPKDLMRDVERIALVTFKLEGVPSIDAGPYLEVVVARPRSHAWESMVTVLFDREARIVGTIESDDHKRRDLVIEKAHNDHVREVWRLSTRPQTADPDLQKIILAAAECQ